MAEEFSPSFTFGKNWKRFLRSYTQERQKASQDNLLAFLKLSDLKGLDFLDIGSGSGLHSASAWLSGAKRIVSFDYDPDSVAATKALHEHFGSPENWTVLEGSALDAAFMEKLGTFDIVYSWGVLHHTGDLWGALEQAARRMKEKSRFFIALYAKEPQKPNWRHWQNVKRRYNESGWLGKRVMEAQYIWERHMDRKWRKFPSVLKNILGYREKRGMHYMTDIRDWLGGWPTEFSSVNEVTTFLKEKAGLALVNLQTGKANTEFLFVKETDLQPMGLVPVDFSRHIFAFPRVDDEEVAWGVQDSVWIFGTGEAGKLLSTYLRERKQPIAGYIDLGTKLQTLGGLPVLAFDRFTAQEPLAAPIILANQYLESNINRLADAGFTNLYNGMPLAKRLAKGR